MSCLIIGNGPSKNVIDMRSQYRVDAIIGVHEPEHDLTNYVCSLDLTNFYKKEKLALDKDIPLILAENSVKPTMKTIVKDAIIFKNIHMKGNSGAFAIEWAISKGFKIIYTAGLDFYSSDTQYIIPQAMDNINRYIKTCGATVYKTNSKSHLACLVKIPEKTLNLQN